MSVVSALRLERAQQLAERDLALAAHDEVDAAVRVLGVGLGREARVVAADDDVRAAGAACGRGAMTRCAVLRWKVMTESPTTSGCVFGHEPLDGLSDPVLNEDQVGGGDVVVGVDVPGEGCQCPVRHPDGDRRHVLERVRHREQQDVHDGSPG